MKVGSWRSTLQSEVTTRLPSGAARSAWWPAGRAASVGCPGPADEFCAAAQSYRSACPCGRGGADGRAGSCVASAMARGQAGAAGRGEGAGRSWTVPWYSCRSECF